MTLALDPGGTSGWSLWSYDALTPLTLLDHGQVANGLDGFIEWARTIRDEEPIDEVVSESFILDGRTMSPDVTPIRIETAIDMIFGRWGEGCDVIYQRNVMKVHADDLLLKRAGYWFKGQEHARDSARHAIALMKVRRHAPTLRQLWPPRTAEGPELSLRAFDQM